MLLGLVAIGLAGRPAFPAEAIAGAFPYVCLCGLALAFAFALARRRAPAALSLVAALAAAAPTLGQPMPRPAPAADASLTIVWANAFKRQSAADAAFAFADARGADAVVFAELPDARPNPAYPYTEGLALQDNSTITVYSRRPISGWRYGAAPGRLPTAFELAGGDGAAITIACAHPAIPSDPAHAEMRAAQIDAAFALAAGADRAIVIGDFNATPWNRALVRAARRAGAARAPTGPTWMSRLPLLGLPIDHAFALRGVSLSAEVGPPIGSDHFPLLIRVGADAAGQP